MKTRILFSILIVVGLLLTTEAATAATVGCPEGKAIQGIDFTTRKLVCVDVVASDAVAWAFVNFDGTLDATRSQNVTATSLFSAAGGFFYYCIDVAVPFENIQVTPSFGQAIMASAASGDPFTSCAPFSVEQAVGDATVQTFDAAGTLTQSGFFILFR